MSIATNPPITMSDADAHAFVTSASAWLRERIDESSARSFVLGLSGGIDSAVVCGLCARAAGADRVLGVIMPSASNPDDAVSATSVAERFGIGTVRVDLTKVADTFYRVMPTASDLGLANEDGTRRQQLATANVRPRLRMTTNYYVANLVGGIVVGTGNKSEATIGYYTKYGDGGVDLFPIIDLYKFEVRAVARALGVPDSVIARPPSAGLWEGQTDEEEIGFSYEVLDAALVGMENGDNSGIDPSLIARIEEMHRVSEHKRAPVMSFRRP